jgi:hypothetical protein
MEISKRFKLEHHSQLQDIKIPSTKPCYMDGINREATELKLHPNMIREDGLTFSSHSLPEGNKEGLSD